MRAVTVLYRNPESGVIEQIASPYDGDISSEVFERLNRRFLKLEGGGFFFPADSMEAYQSAFKNLASTADKINSGAIALTSASRSTYLTGVANISLYHFHSRDVESMRQEYRLVEQQVLTSEEADGLKSSRNASEGADAGAEGFARGCMATDEKELSEAPQPKTAQEIAEVLPGEPNAKTRRDEALMVLNEICRALMSGKDPAFGLEVRNAFAAYIAADGNMLEAAYNLHVSKTTFYRKWPRYIAAAKAIGKKMTVNGTN